MKRNVVVLIALVILVAYAVLDTQKEADSYPASDNPSASQAAIGIEIGNQAPGFALTTLDGRTVQLAEYQGIRVILNFWATWCPPCRAEMPHMQRFFEDYEDGDVVILGVNLTQTEKSRGQVEDFVQEYGLEFPILLDTENKVADQYKVMAYPTSFIIDSNGIIQERFQGAIDYETMKRSISKLK